MGITKVSKVNMEITADYQKLSDLNVAFYNQDVNTAILQFNVTRNDAPVPLGKTNVDGYIVLLHEDGSRIQDNLDIVDEIEGIIQYTIPKEFLKHTGKVLGQVYVAVKGVDDTAVMRQFSFDIEQDLLTAFSAAIKLEYIKTFDDLKEQIKQRVDAIEEAIANGEDYVAQMIETLDAGKKEIAATVAKANTDINKVATDAKVSVVATADTATKDIASTATKATTDITKAVSDGQKKIADTSNTAVTTVTAKAKEVTDAIANNQVVKITDVVDYQKQKITADDGSSLTLSQYDLLNTEDIKNFDGYVTTAANSPTSVSSGYFKRKIRTGYIEVSFGPYNANALYRNAYHFGTKTWFGWEKIAYQSESATTQKQKITADNGAPKYDLSASTDLFAEAAKWGNGIHTFYLSAGAANNPTGSTSYVMGRAQFYGNAGGIEAYDKLGKKYYAPRTGAASFGAWQDYSTSDTGWVPYNTANGVIANQNFKAAGENGFDCSYRVVTQQGVTTKYLRVNMTKFTHDLVVAQLPVNFTKNSQNFYARTSVAWHAIIMRLLPDGKLSAYVKSDDRAAWPADGYVYQEFSWTD